jgi:thiamine-monophosphate kinase
MNEFDFIRQLRRQTESRKRSAPVIKGIGDDASVIRPAADRDLVITTDLLVEGIDFYREATTPQPLGHKALAVSLSDLAAMGARPRWSMISIGLPAEIWRDDFKESFFAGYFALADKYGVTLVGGDVSESKQIVVDSIAIGEVNLGDAVLRSTAQPGDQIFVTGNLGGAAAGLKLIEMGARVNQRSEVSSQRSEDVKDPAREGHSTESPAVANESEQKLSGRGFHYDPNSPEAEAVDRLLRRQLRPEPRVGWGIVLGQENLATAMIDVSDGLSSDLNHICSESNVGAKIDAAAIPIDQDVRTVCGRRALDPLSLALHGGEDFELLFTVRPQNRSRLPKRVDGIAISHLGEVTREPAVWISEKNHVWELKPGGFEHFRLPNSPA